MSQPITDYVCNVVRGQPIITSLYTAVKKALYLPGPTQYCYTFTLAPYGTKVYSRPQLVELYNQSLCTTVQELADEIGESVPTLDQTVLLLLIAKCSFNGLYQAYFKALDLQNALKSMCYTFVNPYGVYAQVDADQLLLSAPQIINYFNTCTCGGFDAPNLWRAFSTP